MTSRERVFRALEFRNPDRAPRDIGMLIYISRFRKQEMDDLLSRYPMDVCTSTLLKPGGRRKGREGYDSTYIDDWGCVWNAGEEGVVGEVKHSPLESWSRIADYQPPWECLDESGIDNVNAAQDENLKSPNPRFMLAGWEVRPFERMQFLRGTENLLVDLAYGTAEVRRLLEMVHEFNLKELDLWCRSSVDGWGFMDDWGSQQSLLISPAMWREYFKPLYREYCEAAHKAGKKVFFHSDGNITAIYEDLVELGIDAINTQLFAMDIEELGRRFKGRITFWGEIDRQYVLSFGTVEDVWKAVGRVRRALDDPRGGAFAMCQWGVETPIANLEAVFDAWLAPIDELP